MQTIILGFDAFDPHLTESLASQGELPNLSRLMDMGGYSRFEVANPPQSEVSWTSIATGVDPGGHGMFDFVHRDPKTYSYFVSLLPTQKKLGAAQFVPPFTAKTIFEQAAVAGFPATSLWWPATFPARLDLTVNSIPGLGTPDIHGKLGAGTFYTSEIDFEQESWKSGIEHFQSIGKDRFSSFIKGPETSKKGKGTQAGFPFQVARLDEESAQLIIGDKIRLELTTGVWSPIIELEFKLGLFFKVAAITRIIITSLTPHVNLYMLPLQIHPLQTPWQYSAPPSFAKQTWKSCGPFLTLGWPQDTTGLEDGCITDDQFLQLCESIFEKRRQVLFHHLDGFREGLLASVFDSLDRIQHMFWRDRQDIIELWYKKLDNLVGEVVEKIHPDSNRLVIVSDHGFTRFDHKIHLNRWLIDKGYLTAQPRHLAAQDQPGSSKQGNGKFDRIDWSKSQAYALGLNSLYLNLSGREGRGIVQKESIEPLLAQLKDELLSWTGPDGRQVVQSVRYRHEAFSGPLVEHSPDLVIGYAPGYRASGETGVGAWKMDAVEPNHDHWGADHCIDSESVPGVLFSNKGLDAYPNPSFRDIPMITIGEEIQGSRPVKPTLSDEDQKTLEERLKGLGYL